MKSKAILMALAMMTTALAGCTGTDGVTEVDEDALNELIQDNLQDFINNTTIVVNNHYHNNTTTNYQIGSGGLTNGTGFSGQVLFSVDYEFSYTVGENNTRSIIYEIEVPDGMAIFCVDQYALPKAYRNSSLFIGNYLNGVSEIDNWAKPIGVETHLDGIQWRCDVDNTHFGGVGEQTLQLHIQSNLENYGYHTNDSGSAWGYHTSGENIDLRLVFSYILAPVIADTDGGA